MRPWRRPDAGQEKRVIADGRGLHCSTLRLPEGGIAQRLQTAAQASLGRELLGCLGTTDVSGERPEGSQYTTTMLPHPAEVDSRGKRRASVQTKCSPVLVGGELVHALDVAVEGLEEPGADMALHAIISVHGQHAEITREGSHLAEFWQLIPGLVPSTAPPAAATGAPVADVSAARVSGHHRQRAAWNQGQPDETNGIGAREPEPWRHQKEMLHGTPAEEFSTNYIADLRQALGRSA
jgi:hypothetical protein